MELYSTDTRNKNVQSYFFRGSPSFMLLYSLFLTMLFSFYILHFSGIPIINFTSKQDNSLHINQLDYYNNKSELCDLFNGSWIPEHNGSMYYTKFSCATIPDWYNCLLQGRPDEDFIHWKWKPDQCTLPRFNPKLFLTLLKGKTMAFIGDSLARNHMESLLCLLSSEESPTQIFRDAEDKYRTWKFPRHNFTLMVLRTEFLVVASERVINGSSTGIFDLHLDKLNVNWTRHLPNIDYAIFSNGNWFLHRSYLYENDNLIGCVYCGEVGVHDLPPGYAIKRVFQDAFKYINECDECSGIVVLLRTFSAPQFEHGAYNEGGKCNRTRPLTREEVKVGDRDWEFRNIQIEEVERARKDGEKNGNMFEIIDVTRAMLMRPDGHPGEHWSKIGKKTYNDCVHWCMPGPIDTWNELLLETLRRKLPIN